MTQKNEVVPADILINASIIVGIAVLLKNHLIELYSIPEE
jgi:hypothetical protein